LARLFDGLREQDLPLDSFEVVVVDDGSGPDTDAVLQREQARASLNLRWERNERAQGPGGARNRGWRAAGAQLIAFTDDDCVPAPAWLRRGLEAHLRDPAAIVQGRTQPDPAELHLAGVFSRTLTIEELGPHYETCNIFYPRELLEHLEGFDEGFGLRPGGEDIDLAWRAIELGRPTRFEPDALVHHAVERLGPVGTLRGATRWTETVRVFARHPQTRAVILERGIFWSGWHYLVVRSLIALALPRPLRRFLLMRHAMTLRARALEMGSGAWAVPYLALHDVLELYGVSRGALRHRTLVI